MLLLVLSLSSIPFLSLFIVYTIYIIFLFYLSTDIWFFRKKVEGYQMRKMFGFPPPPTVGTLSTGMTKKHVLKNVIPRLDRGIQVNCSFFYASENLSGSFKLKPGL